MESVVDVCIVTTIHPPFDGRIYQKELQAYLEAGFTVALVCPWDAPAAVPNGLRWVTLPAAGSRISRLFHAAGAFRAARQVECRSYHIHDLDFLLWAVILKRVTGRPVIYDCHENYPEEILYNKPYIPAFVRRPIAAIVRVLENAAVRYLRYVIVVVPSLVERFSRVRVRPALVRNFPAWQPQRNVHHDRAVICTGSLSAANGAFVLLEIARALKARSIDIDMLVTDRFQSTALKEEFCRAVQSERLPVTVIPKVHATEMGTVLSKACIGLSVEQDVPNMRMGYHTKLFEYMAFGLPVVSSNIDSNRDLVEAAKSGLLVPPTSGAAYADAICRLLADATLFEEQRENGFRAVESTFSWTVEKTRMLEFVRAVMVDAPKASASR
jgi:glycosyltransferase involved in cell wall biosynthesis